MEKKQLLLGDEAIALGALDAGIAGVYAYPGTPSTEITEYIQGSPEARRRGVRSEWCANEKTAMEAALGVSYVGRRALVCMKHVGLNVAADAFINSAMTGVHGGLVVVAADDPSMHSSQNEQDSRFYGRFAFVPVLEPASQQEAYDMVRAGFELSEAVRLPVLLRITTRMAHSRAVVTTTPPSAGHDALSFPQDRSRWVLLPVNARRRYGELVATQDDLERRSETSPHNALIRGTDRKGVIACGIAYNYAMEALGDSAARSILKISQYPLPRALVRQLVDGCDEVLVLEDGQPFVEEQLRGLLDTSGKIRGRLSGEVPRMGELTPDNVRTALGLRAGSQFDPSASVVPRPPALCAGCGHRDVYEILNEVLAGYPDAKVFSDIGCYTLGALPPFRAIDSCVDMGASITMARGAADSGLHPSVAVIGDSTFTHSGITGLLDAVNSRSNVTIVISDNLTTAMTGGQDSAGTGRLEAICAGVGVEPAHIRTVVPLPKNHDEIRRVIKEEIDHPGVSVIIPRRECIQTLKRSGKLKVESGKLADAESASRSSLSTFNSQLSTRKDIILSGVGGQGILSIAAVIGEAALEGGLHIKQAEVHGMSQRGGDVHSNLRIASGPIHSDLIARGEADVVISLEPMEALRYLPWLGHEGWVVTNSAPFVNIPNYPDHETLLAELRALPRAIIFDVDAVAAGAGVARAANIVLLGAAASVLGFEKAALEEAVGRVFGRKGPAVVEMNLKALEAGWVASQSAQSRI